VVDDSVPRWGENEWVGENYGGADTSFHPLAASTPARRPHHVELDYAGLYSDPSFDFDTVDQVVQSDVYEPEAQTSASDSSDNEHRPVLADLPPGLFIVDHNIDTDTNLLFSSQSANWTAQDCKRSG